MKKAIYIGAGEDINHVKNNGFYDVMICIDSLPMSYFDEGTQNPNYRHGFIPSIKTLYGVWGFVIDNKESTDHRLVFYNDKKRN